MANKNIDKNYHLLYKTTNILNGKYYYGIHSTNDLNDNYLGSGKYLRNSIHRHGKDNFKREIIKQFDNREELVQAEVELLTREILEDKRCMNINFGGKAGKLGMVSVKDKDGKTFSVFCDDERYLSGELVHVTKNNITVKDQDGNTFNVLKDDPRYLSGELVGTTKGFVTMKDSAGNTLYLSIDDPRYLSGELFGHSFGMVNVKDINGNYFNVSINDPRYLSGELKHNLYGKTHSNETKNKISNSMKGKQTGSKNGSYGTCWITKDSQNKKIKKELLQSFINDGWIKGRK